jgi:hypothetical protein
MVESFYGEVPKPILGDDVFASQNAIVVFASQNVFWDSV